MGRYQTRSDEIIRDHMGGRMGWGGVGGMRWDGVERNAELTKRQRAEQVENRPSLHVAARHARPVCRHFHRVEPDGRGREAEDDVVREEYVGQYVRDAEGVVVVVGEGEDVPGVRGAPRVGVGAGWGRGDAGGATRTEWRRQSRRWWPRACR
jgi:hypothetical protein